MAEIRPIINQDRKPLWELIPCKQPLRVNIDPCDLCNFRCDFCFQSKSDEFQGCLMTDETFERVLSQLRQFDEPINVIQLFGLGEPLINKNVPSFIKKIREAGVAKQIKLTTNGSLLTHERIDQLMEAKLDELVISLNGLKDADFERIVKKKVDFGCMLDNIQYLFAHRGNCHFHVKIIGDYFSKEEQEYFINTIGPYADTINIDGVTNHWSGLKASDKQQQQYDVGGNMFEEWPICALCFYELIIHSDGTVGPCAADWQKDKQNFGNVYDTTIKEIWESQLRKDMQISFLKGTQNPYIACQKCEYPSAGAGVNLEQYKEELLKRYV